MIKVIKLDSGVRLVMEKMEGVRSVSIGIWCDNGSVNEDKPEEGVSHYIEHMLFKGTENRNAYEIVSEIDSIGGQQNAFTGKENTCFYVKCLDEHFRKSADVLVDMISNPLFDPDEMEREKLVVCEEINMNADDPDDVALDSLEKAVYTGTAMAHPVLGSKENVMSFTHDSLMDYYRRHYSRDHLVVSVAGSFDEDEVIDFFSDKFENLEAEGENVKAPEAADPADTDKKIRIGRDIEQSHLALGRSGLAVTDDRRYALNVLNALFGGGMSSRLFQHIREKKGLAYSIYSAMGSYKNSGIYAICAGIAKDRVDEALDGIAEELKILKDEPVKESEIDSAREQLKSAFIFGQESVQTRMIANGRDLLVKGECISQDEVLKKLDAVTLEDVENIKSLIADFDTYTVVDVCPKSYADR